MLDEEREGLRCRLAGRLDAEGAEEARAVLAERSASLVADVSELGVVDEAGIGLLADLAQRGARLEGLSPYLAMRLDDQRKRRAGSGAAAPRNEPASEA